MRKLRLLCLGLTAILILSLAACAQAPASTPEVRVLTAAPLPTYTPYPTLAPLPTYTPYPTLKPLPTYTLYPSPTVLPTVTLEPTPEKKLGMRSQPVPFDQPYTIKDGETEIVIRIIKTALGKGADQIINDPDSFLKYKPNEGKEFFMAQIDIQYAKGDANTSKSFDGGDWAIDVNNEISGYTIASFKSRLDATLFPGGKTTGWVLFQIPQGSEPDRLRYHSFLADESLWFALK